MNDDVESDGSAEQRDSKGLRKKQRREERSAAQEKERLTTKRTKKVRLVVLWGIPIVLVVLAGWAIVRSPKTNEGDNPQISRHGIHWHPEISITIKGERVTIPANIGVGGLKADTHTHNVNDRIHLEINRSVRERDTRLAKFFDTWSKEFNSQCIFESCNGEEGTVKMFVNGEENFDFENYLKKDRDRIEIRYE